MRQRRQKEIQKENETYYSLLREALPPGPARVEERISAPVSGALTCLAPEGGGAGEKSSRSPDKQLPRPDSSPDTARSNGVGASKQPGSSSCLSNGGEVDYCMERRSNHTTTAPPPTNGDLTDDGGDPLTEPRAILRSNSKSVGA